MPNWCYNNITATGPLEDLEKLRKDVKGKDTEFDFNNLIPMPESLQLEKSSITDTALVAYALARNSLVIMVTVKNYILSGMRFTIERIYERAMDAAKTAKKEWEKFHSDKALDLSAFAKDAGTAPYSFDKLCAYGHALYENIVNYGSATWYDWCCSNWGTKWNANDAVCGTPGVKDDDTAEMEISFSTAWAAPWNIFETMSKLYPSITFVGTYYDEFIGNGWGTWAAKEGLIVDVNGDPKKLEWDEDGFPVEPEEEEMFPKEKVLEELNQLLKNKTSEQYN